METIYFYAHVAINFYDYTQCAENILDYFNKYKTIIILFCAITHKIHFFFCDSRRLRI